jgi:hypothetical protein
MESYLKISDLALRLGRPEISRAAVSFTFYKVKADAGQRDTPEPLQGPLAVSPGFERTFGRADRSTAIATAFMRLGDAYRLSGQPWFSAALAYEGALKSGLGSVGSGADLTMTAAARLVIARRLLGKEGDNLAVLKSASGFDTAGGSFPSWAGLDRNSQNIFASAFLSTIDSYASTHVISETQRHDEAASLFAASEKGMFERAFQLGRLKRRATSPMQLSAIKDWTEARTNFDRAVRRLYAAVDRNARVSSEAMSQGRESSQTARERLLAAENSIAHAFPDLSITFPGPQLIRRVREVLQADEAAAVLLPTQYAVYCLVITKDEVELNHYAIDISEVISRIRVMRSALDPQLLRVRALPQRRSAFSVIDTKALLDVAPFTVGLLGERALSRKRWIIIAHDVLRNISVEAVPLSEKVSEDANEAVKQTEYWPGLSKEIAYLPSLSSLIDLRSGDFPTSRSANAVTVIADPILPGDPRYDSPLAGRVGYFGEIIRRAIWSWNPSQWLGGGDLPPIPETAEIGYSVINKLGGQIDMLYGGQRAKRTLLMASKSLEQSRVLVFATHGETAESYPEFGEPFLVLTRDNQHEREPFDAFTASDIASLELDAELVMLVACNTAASDGTPGTTGFSGLAQSFLQAGARSLAVTEWKVLTRPAYLATNETLETAAKLGAPPAEAVRRGRLLVSKTFPHPSYWAGFVYVGDPGRHWQFKQ